MKNAGLVVLLTCASVSLAGADVVGTLNVHTGPGGHRTTGQDSGQPVAVQVDFSRTRDGRYDLTVWSGDRQFDKVVRVYVQGGKVAQGEASYQAGPVTVHCPATDLKQDGPTSFQVFVQAVFENGEKGGRVLVAEADWQLGSVEDNQPGKRVEPRQIVCAAGSDLDSHATGSFLLRNQSANSLRAQTRSLRMVSKLRPPARFTTPRAEAKPASMPSSWVARIRLPLRHPVHRQALLKSHEGAFLSLDTTAKIGFGLFDTFGLVSEFEHRNS